MRFLKLILIILVSVNIIFTSENPFKIIYKSPVKLWQKISYSTPILDCQFEPSCSNYFLHAVDSTGILPGTIIGADRIIRCNPAARHYQLQNPKSKFYDDGRLIDYVTYKKNINPKYKFLKYAVIPGLGRYKLGREIDGFFSFLFVINSLYKGINHFENNPYKSGIYLSIGTLFWAADFYGTWRISNSNSPNS